MVLSEIFQLENSHTCDLTTREIIDVLLARIDNTNGLEFVDSAKLMRLNRLIGHEILHRDD